MQYAFDLEVSAAAFGVSYSDDLYISGSGIPSFSSVMFPVPLTAYQIQWFLDFKEEKLQARHRELLKVSGKPPSHRVLNDDYWTNASGYMTVWEKTNIEIRLRAARGRGLEQLLITAALTGCDIKIVFPCVIIADAEPALAPTVSAFVDHGEPVVFHAPVCFYPLPKS